MIFSRNDYSYDIQLCFTATPARCALTENDTWAWKVTPLKSVYGVLLQHPDTDSIKSLSAYFLRAYHEQILTIKGSIPNSRMNQKTKQTCCALRIN